MLRTRLWMGAILVGVAALLLLEDRWFAPWFPILFVCYTAASLLAAREFIALMPADIRPAQGFTLAVLFIMAAANWLPALGTVWILPQEMDAGHIIGGIFVAGLLAAFIREMWRFRGPDRIIERIAMTMLVIGYLGVLPSFLAQLRWLDGRATVAIALAVFVPKGNDIGAYFTGKFLTGRLLGRTPMTPMLSPKKTWQGAVGGMLASVAVAIGINEGWPVLPWGRIGAVGFGLTVGLAGVLGDLAESLIKRDLQTKDASQSIPGFGGVLDVVDSLLFAGPVACLWFSVT